MRPSVVASAVAALSVLATAPVLAVPIVPGAPTIYTVDSTSDTGTSFTYNGTLGSGDSLNLTSSGTACLQATGTQYCTNAAGVIVVAGSSGVGQSSQNGPFTFGSLLISISGVGTEEIFLPTAANGSGSPTPPTTLALLPTTFAQLGFGSFSVFDPTVTFTISDTMRTDNAGSFFGVFVVTPVGPGAVPEPASLALLGVGIVGLGLVRRRRRG